MNEIGIFGVGCIGSILAKYMHSLESNSMHYFTRAPKSNIVVCHSQNKFVHKIKCTEPSAFSKKLDWLIICVKEYDLKQALENIPKLVHQEIKIAVFRNGLNLSEGLTDFSTRNLLLETIIDCPAQKNKDAEIIQFYHPKINLPDSLLAKEFISLFPSTEVKFNLSSHWKTDQWKKLIESASLGAIQALTRKPCAVFKDQEIIEIYRQLILEAIEIAAIDGAQISKRYAVELINKLKTYPNDKGSSMLLDVLNGRTIELDAKTGAILKKAKMHNKLIPLTSTFYKLLKHLNKDIA